MDDVRRYRVLVEYEDGDSWDKSFYSAHESLEFFKGCTAMRILLRDDATVSAQRLDDGSWTTAFKSTIKGSVWY